MPRKQRSSVKTVIRFCFRCGKEYRRKGGRPPNRAALRATCGKPACVADYEKQHQERDDSQRLLARYEQLVRDGVLKGTYFRQYGGTEISLRSSWFIRNGTFAGKVRLLKSR